MDRSLQHIPHRLLSISYSNAVTYTASITSSDSPPTVESPFLGESVTCFRKPFCYGTNCILCGSQEHVCSSFIRRWSYQPRTQYHPFQLRLTLPTSRLSLWAVPALALPQCSTYPASWPPRALLPSKGGLVEPGLLNKFPG